MPNASEDIVYKHHNAINSQDEREYLDSVKFPFTYQNYNGVSITIKNEEDYKINYKEVGAIPLFYPNKQKNSNIINIGTAGGMTRLSTGYTFLNIQEQSRYLRHNLENIKGIDNFEMSKKYQFLDKIFLKVLKNNPEKMVNIFQKMFEVNETSVIKFLKLRVRIYFSIKLE